MNRVQRDYLTGHTTPCIHYTYVRDTWVVQKALTQLIFCQLLPQLDPFSYKRGSIILLGSKARILVQCEVNSARYNE